MKFNVFGKRTSLLKIIPFQDPRGGFLPGAGPLVHLTLPQVTTNVRVETGVRQNDEVSVHYDPMIAKLVVWGRDRNEALSILQAKLSEYDVIYICFFFARKFSNYLSYLPSIFHLKYSVFQA